MFAEVIVDISAAEVDRIFDYECGDLDIRRGVRVIVPFGHINVEGFVMKIKPESDVPYEKIKRIASILDTAPIICDEMFELLDYMADKMYLLKVDILRLFIPSAMRGGRVKELTRKYAVIAEQYQNREPFDFIRPSATAQLELFYFLTEECPEGCFVSQIVEAYSASALKNLQQRGIVRVFDSTLNRQPYAEMPSQPNFELTLTHEQQSAVDSIANESGIFLLHGITGSGKTEVYRQCIRKVLSIGKTAIMLVPEISLTPQVLKYFRAAFGEQVAVLHSGLSVGERFDEWRKCLSGEAKVVLGARSAVFAPVQNLGIVIIDEEHDTSYTSDRNPRYKTIDVAKWRVSYHNAKLVLGSATPAVETYFSAKKGDYKLLELRGRINGLPLPDMEIVDMRKEYISGNTSIFSGALRSELDDCVKNGNQAMLFLNRRGYASYIICKSCGYVAKCERCDVSLVYHKEDDRLKCHYCGNMYSTLDACSQCGNTFLREGLIGTEKIVEQLKKLYPNVGVLRMDNDTTRQKNAHGRILGEFGDKKALILVGTQMIAKGHDFPDVTLVGILDADMSLHVNDYRSVERTFQLATQVAGRAGRAGQKGRVVLQTYSPNHYVFKYIQMGDYVGFYDKEINLREVTKYPPFSTIIRVLVTGEDEKKASEVLKNVFYGISELKEKYSDRFIYLSYMRSPLKRIKDEYRMQILIRLKEDSQQIIDEIYSLVDTHRKIRITTLIEVNPIKLA